MTCVSEIYSGLVGTLVTAHLQPDDRLTRFELLFGEVSFVFLRFFRSYTRLAVITGLKTIEIVRINDITSVSADNKNIPSDLRIAGKLPRNSNSAFPTGLRFGMSLA